MYYPRCRKDVKTWKDSWVRDGKLHAYTLCAYCNAILKHLVSAIRGA